MDIPESHDSEGLPHTQQFVVTISSLHGHVDPALVAERIGRGNSLVITVEELH